MQRRRDTHDRRVVMVELTPAGLARITDIFPAHAAGLHSEPSVAVSETAPVILLYTLNVVELIICT